MNSLHAGRSCFLLRFPDDKCQARAVVVGWKYQSSDLVLGPRPPRSLVHKNLDLVQVRWGGAPKPGGTSAEASAEGESRVGFGVDPVMRSHRHRHPFGKWPKTCKIYQCIYSIYRVYTYMTINNR